MPYMGEVDRITAGHKSQLYKSLLTAVKGLTLRSPDGYIHGQSLSKYLGLFPGIVRVLLDVAKDPKYIYQALDEAYASCPSLRELEFKVVISTN